MIVRCAGPGWQELSSDGADFGGERTLRSRRVAVVQDKCVDLTLVLGAKDRTRCVEQLAVRLQAGPERIQQTLLLRDESVDITFAPQLPIGWRRTTVRCGIEQDAIERDRPTHRYRLRRQRAASRSAQSREIAGYPLEPRLDIVECDQFELGELREMRCLASGRSAGVEHSHTVVRIQ